MKSPTDVIIVGGGVSGLYLGYILKKHGLTIDLLEASTRTGGRIRSELSFGTSPIELGAEYVHGKKSTLFEYLSYLGIKTKKESGRYFYFMKNGLVPFDEAADETTFQDIDKFFDGLYKYEGEDISVADYFGKDYRFKSYSHIIEAFVSVYGASASQIGIGSTSQADKRWRVGSQNYFLQAPYESILDEFVEFLAEDLYLDKCVRKIVYSGDMVEVELEDGEKRSAKMCVVTIPLGVLKSGDVGFSPLLPEKKQAAISALGMGDGMKVILKFSAPFWGGNMAEINGGEYSPSYYVRSTPDTGEHFLVGYVMGTKASFLAQLGDKIPRLLLQELDFMFGGKAATEHFERWTMVDWLAEPYIKGAYSYLPPNSFGLQEDLAAPVGKKLYFAGEAANTLGHHGTVHGAMETAEVTAKLIFDDLGINPDIQAS